VKILVYVPSEELDFFSDYGTKYHKRFVFSGRWQKGRGLMQGIRKFMTIHGDTIHLEELRDWQEKQVEVIVLPAGETIVPRRSRKAGSLKGKIHISPEFYEPLKDFDEYM
jgi:hypothetical protein